MLILRLLICCQPTRATKIYSCRRGILRCTTKYQIVGEVRMHIKRMKEGGKNETYNHVGTLISRAAM
jgi:hypothetical protein